MEAMTRRLAEERVISLFIRLHPLHNYPEPTLTEFGQVVEHGPTVWIDLGVTEEELWSQTRSRVRTYINRMHREGYAFEVDSEWRGLDEFARLYTQTMKRVGAEAGYFFDRQYFEDLRDNLGEHAHLAVVRAGEEIACAGIFSEVSGLVEYHLGGTEDVHRKLGPTRLLFHHMARWAKERGNHTLHLGGGVGAAEDSLFHFKAGFSPHRATFRSWRVACDSEALAAASAAAGLVEADGFFPPYRGPRKPPID